MAVELNALGAAELSDLLKSLKSLAMLNIVVANVELGQSPHILDSIGKGDNATYVLNFDVAITEDLHDALTIHQVANFEALPWRLHPIRDTTEAVVADI
jgi:hypothetical protein